MKRGITNRIAGLLLAAVAVTGCVLVQDAQAGLPERRPRTATRRPTRLSGARATTAAPPSHAPAPGTNFRLSAGASNAVATDSPAVELGVYSGLAFQGGRIYPAWADNSTSLPANPDLPTRNLDIATLPVTVSGSTATLGTLANASAMAEHQFQPAIAVNPGNPLNAVIASDHGDLGLFKSYTTDGGVTWNTAIIATGTDGLAAADGSASVSFDSYGNCFLAYQTPLPTGFFNCAVAVSTNGGVTFTPVTTVGSGDIETPTLVTGPGLNGNGSVWVSYFDFLANNEDGAVRAAGAPVTGLGTVGSFTAQSAPNSSFGFAPDLAIGPAGQVILAYQDGSDFEGPSELSVHVDANGLTAGGFGAAVSPATSNVGWFEFIPPQNQQLGIDAEVGLAWDRSGGPHNGRVYLVYTDEVTNESNNTDIVLRYSDNNGGTWSAPIRVNDDAGTRSQYLPRIALDQSTGNVAITWYDCRNDGGTGSATDSDTLANTDAEYWGALIFNPTAKTIQLGAATYSVNEADGTATISVVRIGDTSTPATVQYATSNGMAAAGSDYTASSGTLSFGAGEASKTIQVPIAADALLESGETFTVTLSSPIGDTLGSPSSATVTIADNINVTAPSSVTATATSASTIQVAWTDNSANEDNFILERKVDGGSFQTLANPTASPYNDNTVSVGHTYTYRVRARKGALQSANSPEASAAVVTYQLSAASYSGQESAGAVTVTINRSAFAGSSTVDLQLSAGTATVGADVTQPATVAFAANETSKVVSIAVADDHLLEGTEAFTVTLASPSAGVFVVSPSTATVSIQDDTAITAPSGLTATVLSPGGAIQLSWTDNSDNETQFAIERKVGAGAFAPYQTASANATSYTDEVTPGISYAYRVRAVGLLQSSDYSATAAAVVTLIQFADPTAGVAEGAQAELTVTRTGDTTIPVTVAYSTTDQSATSPADFTAATGTVTFAPGETSKKITVTTVGDLLVEGTEQFLVNLGTVTGTGAALGGRAGIVVTISDEPLVAPTQFTAVVVNLTTVRLDWMTSSPIATQYLVERRVGATGQFTPLATTAVGVRTYQDTTVAANTDYTYRVRAVSGATQSDPSAEATVRITSGAKVSITPTKLSFGTLRIGSPRRKLIKIKNTGKVELRGTVGLPTSPFSPAGGGGSFILAPKQTRTVMVDLVLNAAGTVNGTLVITTTDPKKQAVTIKLTGKAK